METTMERTGSCACGCGEPVSERSHYRPGHDSRHVSRVGHAVAFILANETDESTRDSRVRQELDSLPSERLVNKANSIAHTDLTKGRVNPFSRGQVKVAGKPYAAVKRPDGSVIYFKGTREVPASKKAAETFTLAS